MLISVDSIINSFLFLSEDFLQQQLRQREEQGLFRQLQHPNHLIDFSSNDYLGFASSKELFERIQNEISYVVSRSSYINGSSGSRLLTGNLSFAEELERFIADYHKADAGLIFNSGYSANTGLISSVAGKEDIIFYDELSHASIYDGVRLSKAGSFPFRHNDLSHLEERLIFYRNNYKGNSSCFVIAESVYSMDGDFTPLQEIVQLCEKYKAHLIVDEAHATGIFGRKGEGRVVETGMEKKVFARVHTFGKALGCHGAIVLGSYVLRDFLINFSRSFIYTTALPLHSLVSIKCAYELLKKSSDKILIMNKLIILFNNIISSKSANGFLHTSSPIQSFIIEGNEQVRSLASLIQKDGFDVRPILNPTVPKGKERIRICLHAFNTEDQITELLLSFNKNGTFVSKNKATLV